MLALSVAEGKVLSGTFYGFSHHWSPGQTAPISLLLYDPSYETSVIKQSHYNDFKISFLAYQVPGLTLSLTITEAVSSKSPQGLVKCSIKLMDHHPPFNHAPPWYELSSLCTGR